MQQLPPPAAWARVRDYLGWAGLPALAALSPEGQVLLSQAGQWARFPCPTLRLATEAEYRLFRGVWDVCATARVDVPCLRLAPAWLRELGDRRFPGLRVQRLELVGMEVTDEALQRLRGAFPATSHLGLRDCTLGPNGTCLANLPSGLESLCLEDCKGLTDGQMKSLPVSLRHLSIRRCVGITDLAGLEALSKLQVLHLESCTDLVDQGLGCLPELEGLVELSLHGCSRLTDAVTESVAKATGLRQLDLSYCKWLTNAGVQNLRALNKLQGLNLHFCYLLREGALEFLSELPELRQLNLGYCHELAGPALMERLNGLQNLRELKLEYCSWLTGELLPRLPRLQRLVISRCMSLNDEKLSGLPSVEELDLSACHWLTDAGLESLGAKQVSLWKLNLGSCDSITAYGLKHLPVNLRWLSLRRSSGDGVPDPHPGLLPQGLEELDLSECRAITDAVLPKMAARHRSLWKLDLSYYDNIANEKLKHLPKNLRWLSLRGCPGLTAGKPGLTAEGLAQLPPGLEELDLSQCSWLTDAGLKSLYRHYRLRCLRLEQCGQVTPRAVQTLLRALPGLQVEGRC